MFGWPVDPAMWVRSAPNVRTFLIEAFPKLPPNFMEIPQLGFPLSCFEEINAGLNLDSSYGLINGGGLGV